MRFALETFAMSRGACGAPGRVNIQSMDYNGGCTRLRCRIVRLLRCRRAWIDGASTQTRAAADVGRTR